MQDWLLKRLAGSKKDAPLWTELAEALEFFWDQNVEPYIQGLENNRSIFTTPEAFLNQRLLDMGDFFDVNLRLGKEGSPLDIVFRRDEIQWKNTILPIESILRRNFHGLNTRWEPLYAPVDGPYDHDHFYSEAELAFLNENIDDYFMTSRGRMFVDDGHLRRLGIPRNQFLNAAESEVSKVKPVHIVYEGEYFFLSVSMDHKPLTIDVDHPTVIHSETSLSLTPANMAQDNITIPVLYELSPCTHYNNSHWFGFDEIPADFVPLDTPLL